MLNPCALPKIASNLLGIISNISQYRLILQQTKKSAIINTSFLLLFQPTDKAPSSSGPAYPQNIFGNIEKMEAQTMKTGTANLPLHGGSAPPWLFKRMRLLAGEIVEALVCEQGQEEFLRRIADPHWFQAFSCVLGFDWHSSGTTTVTTGALKMALSPERHGIAVAGGKGKTSTKAPSDIQKLGDAFSFEQHKVAELVRASKMSAKVDNALVQDGYQLYHHAFFFTEKGEWAVVQQGMNDSYARRYHWLSDRVKSFVEEPHSAICSQRQEQTVLDLTARESAENRKATLDLVKDGPAHLGLRPAQRSLLDFGEARSNLIPELSMPRRHQLVARLDIDEAGRKALHMAYQLQPSSYEELVALRGLGPMRIRALALISELIYGASPSWRDPAKFSFAHGGKDGTPFPVDRKTYDRSIRTLHDAIEGARLEKKEKYEAIKRLARLCGD
jgi:hypothetical protein